MEILKQLGALDRTSRTPAAMLDAGASARGLGDEPAILAHIVR